MRAVLLTAALYIAGALLLGAATLRGGFVSDDFVWLYDAAHVTQVSDLLRVRQVDFAPDDGVRVSPLELAFFWGGLSAFGPQPLPLRCALLVVVGLNAWLLHLWVRRVTASDAAACVAGITFLVFPLHAEAATWLSAVNEPLAGAAMLTCLLAFLNSREHRSTSARVASWAALTAALLAKVSAATLPVLLLATDVLLLPPVPWKQRVRAHLPCWAITATILLARAHAVRADGAGRLNPADLAFTGTARAALALIVGPETATTLLPHDSRATIVGALLASILWGVLLAFALRLWRRAPDTTQRRRWGVVTLHLGWMPLTALPYAAWVAGAPLQDRYSWQGSMAIAALGGLAWAGLALPRTLHRAATAALVAIWIACAAAQLWRAAPYAPPDDTAALAAQVRDATAGLGQEGRLYVYAAPGQWNESGRAAALFAGLPPERVGDFSDVSRRGALDAADVMLFWDPAARCFLDLTTEGRRALAAPRHRRAAAISPEGLVPWKTWDMRISRDRAAWRLEGARAVDDGTACTVQVKGTSDTLVSPLLNLSPFDLEAVEIRFRVLARDGRHGSAFLGWSSPIQGGWGPSRSVPATATANATTASGVAWFRPPTAPAWWREGGAQQIYFAPSSVPARVTIEQITLWTRP